MGEDWGPDPFPKALQVMKDFSVVPLKRGITESGQYTAGQGTSTRSNSISKICYQDAAT